MDMGLGRRRTCIRVPWTPSARQSPRRHRRVRPTVSPGAWNRGGERVERVHPGTCSRISGALGTHPAAGVRAAAWPGSWQHKGARSCITPPHLQAWPSAAGALPWGCKRQLPGPSGLPPCQGAEGLEGSHVSRQPLVPLRASVLLETFGETGTGTTLAGCGRHKGGGRRSGAVVRGGAHPTAAGGSPQPHCPASQSRAGDNSCEPVTTAVSQQLMGN